MAQKKADLFSQANTNPVYGKIQEATQEPTKRRPRREPTDKEKTELLQGLHTAGYKGVKLPRMNVGFTQDSYDYVQTMSRAAGMNLTEFINHIIDDHRKDHADLFTQARNFQKKI